MLLHLLVTVLSGVLYYISKQVSKLFKALFKAFRKIALKTFQTPSAHHYSQKRTALKEKHSLVFT